MKVFVLKVDPLCAENFSYEKTVVAENVASIMEVSYNHQICRVRMANGETFSVGMSPERLRTALGMEVVYVD